jgi:putative PIN family toxin of toxin-antitoxin system
VKVVFDSNIFISAFVLSGGRASEAIDRIIEGRDDLVLSADLINEILSVLASKFDRDKETISRTAVFLSDLGTVVKPSRRITVLKDEPDNRILECALTGKADAIVTGDKAMLQLKEFSGIRILSLKEYLEH